MKGFEHAWAWAQADHWLQRSLTPGALDKVTKRLKRHEDEVRTILNELAATRAWGHCLGSMTEAERMHLVAWSKAVRKIGKGTGKYAARYRREAREHMEQCRSAIPAWVMPTYRVAETVRPGQDSFDVVIVDEASQSGLDSLFLHYLGAKLIVVGDDQQISPDNVGVNLQDVEDLRRQHIPDIPLSTTFGARHQPLRSSADPLRQPRQASRALPMHAGDHRVLQPAAVPGRTAHPAAAVLVRQAGADCPQARARWASGGLGLVCRQPP